MLLVSEEFCVNYSSLLVGKLEKPENEEDDKTNIELLYNFVKTLSDNGVVEKPKTVEKRVVESDA